MNVSEQFENQRSGYLDQTFENDVRTAFRTAGRDALSPKTALFRVGNVFRTIYL